MATILEKQSLELLASVLAKLESGFKLPDLQHDFPYEQMETVLKETAYRLQDNYPYFHPFYMGQMLKPPHPIARTAYALAQWINPNNHALDGGKASSRMEKEAVKEIAAMMGWPVYLGHLTGGGTMANLEALWVAGKIHPGKYIVASDLAHYTHQRISEVLGLPFQKVASTPDGQMDINALEDLLKGGNVGTVVATMGTTGLGAVDSLENLQDLQERYGFRIHADAAYGGYFVLAGNLRPATAHQYQLISRADSIVIDPHKHGLQPYGCGCVLFKDPEVARYYLHDSPYTYYSSEEIHLGEISLECSRPGAAAVALWATQRLLPLIKGGAFAAQLEQSRSAAVALYGRLQQDGFLRPLLDPELDIVVWAPRELSTSAISALSKTYFDLAEQQHLYLSLFKYPSDKVKALWPDVHVDSPYTTFLRACLLKPEHASWLDALWDKMQEVSSLMKN